MITMLDPLKGEVAEVPWWPPALVFELPGIREMDANSPYVDYVAGVSPEDAALLDEEAWGKMPNPKPYAAERERLRERFARRDAVQWVLVQIYEWESGLGD
jgi:hypothetical protein